ncbi:MAG: Gfo/Idh/MocA family oxidoreductase [Acidobacteriota bacterium]
MGPEANRRSIAVVGCGHWGPNHVRAFHALPDASVSWAVDANADRRRYVATRFAGVRVTDRYEDVLDDPSVDAVVVATPAATHAAIAGAALRAGKHVLCEKPLATSSPECVALLDQAAASGVVLMVGHVFLFNPGILALKDLVAGGALGRLCYASAIRANAGPIRDDINAAWDLASHELAIFDFLFEETPVAVSASGRALLTGRVEDVSFITVTYPGDVMVGVTASWLHPRKVREISVVGDVQMATFDDLAPRPLTVSRSGRPARTEPYYDSYGEFHQLAGAGERSEPEIVRAEPLSAQARGFLDAITTGCAGASAGVHGWDVVRTLEAVTESMRRHGAPVDVPGRWVRAGVA